MKTKPLEYTETEETYYNVYDTKRKKPMVDRFRTATWKGYQYVSSRYSWDDDWGHFRYSDEQDLPKGYPEAICACGNIHFQINYGDYECIATCSKCGKSDTVYDG